MLQLVLAVGSLLIAQADRDALPIATFAPYPAYRGLLNTSGVVLLTFSTQNEVTINYNLNHADSRCVAPDPHTPNSCGLHVHVGFSCAADSLVGGHYFNSLSNSTDPWPTIGYTTSAADQSVAMGQVMVNFGFPLENTKGRAFVLHDYQGVRIGCALLPATTDQVRLGHIGVYPDYMGSLNSIMGMLSLDFRATSVQLTWALQGLDPACSQKSDMENSCGIHIHEGTSCDLASAVGGHYYDKTLLGKDVWQTVFYTANADGSGSGSANVEFGFGFEGAKGRTVVIHDQSGNRISCSVLPLHASRETVTMALQPLSTATYNITGRVVAEFRGEGVKLSYNLMGATNCPYPGLAPNSCGIHIHAGFTCSPETVLGHYYNPTTFPTDPWSFAPYLTGNGGTSSTPSIGSVMVSYGRDWDHSKGRVVVVHDSNGTKVACAVLPATTDRVEVSVLSKLTTDTSMEGSAVLDFRATSVHIAYSLINVEPTCSQPGPANNSCGIHIHQGTSCESRETAGKHFFSTPEDPWGMIHYTANGSVAAGAVSVEYGYGFEDSKGRVLVVHNYGGAMVLCGLISTYKLRDITGLAKLMPTAESTVEGTALLDFRGMGTKMIYTLSGVDPRCSVPGNASLSCGMHIHRNFSCDNMMVGTHYFNASQYPDDPWEYVVYTANGTMANGSVVVSYGEDFARSEGRALVVHNYDGVKVSCATIPQITDRVNMGSLVQFADKQVLSGPITLDFRATSVHIAYNIKGVDPRCVSRSAANNSCGLHIHMGMTCDLEQVGAHFFDPSMADPWLPDYIVANAEGEAAGVLDIEYGYGYAQSKGRALVLHNQDGVKVACALIPAVNTLNPVVVESWTTFSGYSGVYAGVSASVNAGFKAESVTLAYSLANVPCECSTPGPAKNSCGLHIHEGVTCSDATAVGGHYFDASKFSVDPWAVAVYSANPCLSSSETSGTTAQGSLTVQFGFGYEATKNRVMVVHDYNGVKIACAPLTPTTSYVLVIVLAVSGALLLLVTGLIIFLRRRRKSDPNGILHQNLLANDRANAMRRTLSVNV